MGNVQNDMPYSRCWTFTMTVCRQITVSVYNQPPRLTQFSISPGHVIEYRPAWLELRQGTFTCVGWHVTLIPYGRWRSAALRWVTHKGLYTSMYSNSNKCDLKKPKGVYQKRNIRYKFYKSLILFTIHMRLFTVYIDSEGEHRSKILRNVIVVTSLCLL